MIHAASVTENASSIRLRRSLFFLLFQYPCNGLIAQLDAGHFEAVLCQPRHLRLGASKRSGVIGSDLRAGDVADGRCLLHGEECFDVAVAQLEAQLRALDHDEIALSNEGHLHLYTVLVALAVVVDHKVAPVHGHFAPAYAFIRHGVCVVGNVFALLGGSSVWSK